MKRYMLFAGHFYYPRGGMDDFMDSFDELSDARAHAVKLVQEQYDWYHVFDTESMIEVANSVANY